MIGNNPEFGSRRQHPAVGRNRTGDLVLTKDALYLLSYNGNTHRLNVPVATIFADVPDLHHPVLVGRADEQGT